MVSFDNLLEVVQWAFQRTGYWTRSARLQIVISTKDHPISIKFGTQQQVWNSVTVTRPNVIFKNLRCRTRTATI